MADLFDLLKSGEPIKKSKLPPAKLVSPPKSKTHSLHELINEHKSKSSNKRRESLPSSITVGTVLKKSKSQKARSLSPPKYGAKINALKTLKVKLERKKFEEFLTQPLEEHANNIRKKQEKSKDEHKHPKTTPTKAQQKLFEPLLAHKKLKSAVLKQFNVKPCKVRIHRDNLKKLANEFQNKNVVKKDEKLKNIKRPATSTSGDSPPSKKGKLAVDNNKVNKAKNNFFIKLNTSPSTKLEKKLKNISKSTSSSEAFHNKMKNSKFNNTTMPTKFSRSELFRSFGKRFFNVHVKIERCTHPLMLTFESNERARRLQAKRNNKSKNLSVSFSEQVEIFGDSSDPDDSCDEDFCALPTNRKSNASNSLFTVPSTPVVMPARLKKVENGKVVDDIKLDPTLFIDPKILITSTPFSPGRKKRDHKSFSALKDETSPSPRKEQLKMANERVQLSSLRRLNIEEDEDEDDDCEYIVPIELPQRRASRTSSNATLDDLTSVDFPLADSPLNFPEVLNNDVNTDNTNLKTNTNKQTKNIEVKNNLLNLENGSEDSFQSAKDNFDKNNEIKEAENQCSSLRAGLNLDLEADNTLGNLQQTNGNACNETGNKHLDDISMNLFLEDSQTNDDDNHSKSFVVSLINETIDKLSKDIDENTSDKSYTDTI